MRAFTKKGGVGVWYGLSLFSILQKRSLKFQSINVFLNCLESIWGVILMLQKIKLTNTLQMLYKIKFKNAINALYWKQRIKMNFQSQILQSNFLQSFASIVFESIELSSFTHPVIQHPHWVVINYFTERTAAWISLILKKKCCSP